MFIDTVVPDLNGNYCVTAHDKACERRAALGKLRELRQKSAPPAEQPAPAVQLQRRFDRAADVPSPERTRPSGIMNKNLARKPASWHQPDIANGFRDLRGRRPAPIANMLETTKINVAIVAILLKSSINIDVSRVGTIRGDAHKVVANRDRARSVGSSRPTPFLSNSCMGGHCSMPATDTTRCYRRIVAKRANVSTIADRVPPENRAGIRTTKQIWREP